MFRKFHNMVSRFSLANCDAVIGSFYHGYWFNLKISMWKNSSYCSSRLQDRKSTNEILLKMSFPNKQAKSLKTTRNTPQGQETQSHHCLHCLCTNHHIRQTLIRFNLFGAIASFMFYLLGIIRGHVEIMQNYWLIYMVNQVVYIIYKNKETIKS